MEDADFKNLNVSVIGLGVVGGSFAMALKELGVKNLFGVDIDRKTLEKAESMGIIDKGYTEAETPLKVSDLVIICLYPKQIKGFVKKNINNFKPCSIITDTAGVKNGFVKEICDMIPDNIDFIFGHPMAGREKRGIDYASKEVLKSANYIITPTKKNKEKNLRFIESLVKKMGFKSTVRVSPERHDEVISYTSQLPHAIAVALINSDSFDSNIGLFIGDSYRDLTRIAKINDELWTELFIENSENLIKQIELFERKISIMKEAVKNHNTDLLVENFKEASKRREEIS